MVDCSLVGVALVELFVLAHRASWDLLSLVLLPAVLESSAVLLLCAQRRGMALQLVSQLVLPYAACTLCVAGIAQCRAPPERAAA